MVLVGSEVAAEAVIVETTAMLGMVIIVMFKTMVVLVVFRVAAILVLTVVAPVDIIEVTKLNCCEGWLLNYCHTFNKYSDVTEAGVTGYCSSAAVDDSVDSVILRGGQNTLIVASLCGGILTRIGWSIQEEIVCLIFRKFCCL